MRVSVAPCPFAPPLIKATLPSSRPMNASSVHHSRSRLPDQRLRSRYLAVTGRRYVRRAPDVNGAPVDGQLSWSLSLREASFSYARGGSVARMWRLQNTETGSM